MSESSGWQDEPANKLVLHLKNGNPIFKGNILLPGGGDFCKFKMTGIVRREALEIFHLNCWFFGGTKIEEIKTFFSYSAAAWWCGLSRLSGFTMWNIFRKYVYCTTLGRLRIAPPFLI